MERLKERDFRQLFYFIHELYSARDIETFRSHVIRGLLQILPCDMAAYNEIDTNTQRIVALHETEVIPPEDVLAVERHMDEHPIIKYFSRTGDGQALTISDFLNVHQFHHLEVYQEFYRKYRVEDQLAFCLPARQSVIMGFAVNRSRRNFTRREKTIINLLRPHLMTAYENIDFFATITQALGSNQEVIILTKDGKAQEMSERARQWLTVYFGSASRPETLLAETLERWANEEGTLRKKTKGDSAPHRTLTVDREGRRLRARGACRFHACA